MRKLIAFFFLLACAATLHAQYDEYDNRPVKPFVLPGKGKINVETLNKKIDFNMDISQLNVAELRVLRNAIPARKGYRSTPPRGMRNCAGKSSTGTPRTRVL